MYNTLSSPLRVVFCFFTRHPYYKNGLHEISLFSCDEFLRLYLWEKDVDQSLIDDLHVSGSLVFFSPDIHRERTPEPRTKTRTSFSVSSSLRISGEKVGQRKSKNDRRLVLSSRLMILSMQHPNPRLLLALLLAVSSPPLENSSARWASSVLQCILHAAYSFVTLFSPLKTNFCPASHKKKCCKCPLTCMLVSPLE